MPLVAYYPVFNDPDQYHSHLHRAGWYLPYSEGVVDEVVLGVTEDFAPQSRPDHFCSPRHRTDHIRTFLDRQEYLRHVRRASLLLVWRKLGPSTRANPSIAGKRLVNVNTHDPEAMEWGSYCNIHWRLSDKRRRDWLLRQSHERFVSLVRQPRVQSSTKSLVLGTGPSVDRVFDYDVSDCIGIVCNSIVKDNEMLAHVKPSFVTAGDAVSHFGVSRYAEQFREDLARTLVAHDLVLLTTAKYGNLLRVHYPELQDRILLCPQESNEPNYDLVSRWDLPRLDSTLNVHMLPLAATLSNEIYMLGLDGRRPDGVNNEDFWNHSTRAQYHDLVDTGHLAHPMFDVRRQKVTESFFRDSTMRTIALGEARHNKRYYSLSPSFTPAIGMRFVSHPNLKVRTQAQPEVARDRG